MRAWEKSKEEGMCLFPFSESIWDLKFLQDIDDHEYKGNLSTLLIFLLWIFYFLMSPCCDIEEREEEKWEMISGGIMFLVENW